MELFSHEIEILWNMLSQMTLIDVIDILCVTLLLYYIYKFISDRRAGKLALGVLFIILFLFLSELFEMHVMQFIFKNVFQVGMITLVIVFQPELRSALEKMGGKSIKSLKSIAEQKEQKQYAPVIADICDAVVDMSEQTTGALIVFERSTKLGDLAQIGTVIDAVVTSSLIKNIFFNKAPLHDGAMIIRDGRLYAAGCLLPLSTNTDLIKDLGTRHRAAIGMSENSDAVVVVVSEETGVISVACEGQLKRNFTRIELQAELNKYLIEAEQGSAKKVRAKFYRHQTRPSGQENPKEHSQK